MSDGDVPNPCECVWSQEMSMRRLLSMIRQSQSLCTDSECYEEESGLSGESVTEGFTWIVPMIFLTIAFVMMVVRPMVTRASKSIHRNPEDDHENDDNEPRAPEAY